MTNTSSSLGLKLGTAVKLPQPVPSPNRAGWVASDPMPNPSVFGGVPDGADIINGVIQTQLPHVLANNLTTSSYYWNAIR